MKKQISIIGCGWLGLPLAKFLITKGFDVKGSTTSKEKLDILQKASIDGFIINLNEEGITGNYSEFLKQSETVIINIPPGLRTQPHKNHVLEIIHLITVIERYNIKNVLYISSTSVFKDDKAFTVIDDKTLPNATKNSSQQLIRIEKLLQENTNFNTTILRFSGLFDAKRHPANYLSGKKNVSNPSAPINLIHKDDCIEIIFKILDKNHWNVVFNASYNRHPSKKNYYTNYCKTHSLKPPEFNTTEKSKGKIIDSTKLVQLLNYTFKQTP